MCVFWEEISVYAKEVDYKTAIKVSFTWEISSKDIAGCKIEDSNDLLRALNCMLVSKIQIEASINFEEMKNDERFSEEDIMEIKQFMEEYPHGFKEGYFQDKSEERITDGFPIKVEVVREGNLENWTKDLPIESEFHIEVNGKAVDVNQLMSMVNEYHQSLDDWTCEFPVDYMSVA